MAESDIELSITRPPIILGRHWDIYQDARQKYYDKQRADKKAASDRHARWLASLALYKAGYVHIEGKGVELIKPFFEMPVEDVPESLMTLIILHIGVPIEEEVELPFLGSLKLSPDTTLTVTVTPSRAP